MKQVAQNYKTGELAVLDVPVPACAPGGVLVRTLFSLISTGTELMKVGESRLSLLGKARARPDQLKKVLETMQQQGALSTYRKAMNRLDSYTPLGYSLAGVVLEVGRGAEEFHVGQVVACGGNEFALHAEVNWVPINLCVPVPDGVGPQLAAFATVGAIALQGIRQSDAKLGDSAVVIGLGLVGQLVVQLLVASGVKVFGFDMVPERCHLAEKAGALMCQTPEHAGVGAVENALTGATCGLGADHVFLAASGGSNQPVELAARLARDRGTVIDIGKCKLDLPWNAYYEKELEVRFSRSYGPGRYDPTYEIAGVDYPAGYVRWTERRNMACFIDLIANGSIDPEILVSGTFRLEEASDVYGRLERGDLRGTGFLFRCEDAVTETMSAPFTGASATACLKTVTVPARKRPLPADPPIRVGFIGAGNYASSMLLPHLATQPGVELVRVATRRSLSAVNAKKKFSFAEAGTDTERVLEDDSIEAVFIVTRHSSHAALTCAALRAGKAVYVEKPLALSYEELEEVVATIHSTGNDQLMVGFNRRFAPMLQEMRKRFGDAAEPVLANYFVNAGQLPPDSWYRDEGLEGSRFVGEGGHFVDTLSWWIGADPVDVTALATKPGDNVQVSLRYGDGSLGTVTYFTNGHARFPKETFEAASGGRVARMDNFRAATVWSGRRRRTSRTWTAPDKGQRAELEAFVGAVRAGGPMPISLTSLVATTRATFAAQVSLANRTTERV